MRPLRELVGRNLVWRRPNAFSGSYDLVVDDEVVIEVRTLGLTRRTATIQTAEGRWTVRPERKLGGRRRILEDAEGNEAGRYGPDGLRAGLLRLEDGECYRITTAWFLRSVEIAGSMGSKLAILRWRWPSFRDVATVSIEPAGTAERRLGLLTAMAFVELVGRRRRAAGASGGG